MTKSEEFFGKKLGDKIIIEASEFRTNEALFTGEAIPVEKRADILLEEITEQNDRTNMIY